MKRPSFTVPAVLPVIGLFLFVAVGVPAVEAPSISPALSDELQRLPLGISGQPSLFVRYKHVESVMFYGAGVKSKFSFMRGESLLPEGLSLSLRNDGPFS